MVTVVDFTSPANKIGEKGRQMYIQKQGELAAGGINLVELDLIRSGEWILRVPEDRIPVEKKGLYHACVTRGKNPWRFEVYPIQLHEPLPGIRVPLRPTDPDAVLDLQALIDQVYVNGSYGYDVNYTQPPSPPLLPHDARWAQEQLKRASE